MIRSNGLAQPDPTGYPILVWLNLDSKQEVDELREIWKASSAKIVSPVESKPWKLREFTVSDLDGNLFRVFYDIRGDPEQQKKTFDPRLQCNA